MTRRPVTISTGRHPFEVAILAAGVVVAVAFLGRFESPNLSHLLPVWCLYAWSGVLLAGGATALVGVWWRGFVATSLIIEAAGLTAVAATTSVYALALLTIGWPKAMGTGCLVASIAIASIVRAWQIRTDIRAIFAALRAGEALEVALLAEPGDER